MNDCYNKDCALHSTWGGDYCWHENSRYHIDCHLRIKEEEHNESLFLELKRNDIVGCIDRGNSQRLIVGNKYRVTGSPFMNIRGQYMIPIINESGRRVVLSILLFKLAIAALANSGVDKDKIVLSGFLIPRPNVVMVPTNALSL